MRLYRQPSVPTDKVPQHLADKFENEAGKYWEAFYKRNADKFFKDRHYFDKEFPELLEGQLTVLEVGCGVGNSVFPLLAINPQLRVYACDFSATAVEIVQAHPDYNTERVAAFVADITTDELQQHVPARSVDYCSMVFVLSAVAPEKMPQAIRNVASVLKPCTGRVLFRDYAEGDLAQTRLEGVNGSRFIRRNFYVRGDGTCCYYYTEAGLRALFASEGFVCESHLVHARVIENRKSGVKMHRRWVQAVFRYAPDELHSELRQVAKQQWEAAQQQQQQATEPLPDGQPPQQQQQQQQWGDGSSSSSSVTVACARHQWKLPEALSSNSSSASSTCEDSSSTCRYLHLLALELDKLLQQQQQQQQQLKWLGLRALLLPPWLILAAPEQQQQQQHPHHGQCLNLQEISGPPRIAVHNRLQAVVSSSSSTAEQQYRQYTQGAAAALIALVAVRLGAKRVYAVMPGKDDVTDDAGPYELGFNTVLQLNECDVVIERVRQRRWAVADSRQLQLLQRQLQEQQKFNSVDVVIGQAAAVVAAAAEVEVGRVLPAARDLGEGSCQADDLQAVDIQQHDELCSFLNSIWSSSEQKQVLLLLQDRWCMAT